MSFLQLLTASMLHGGFFNSKHVKLASPSSYQQPDILTASQKNPSAGTGAKYTKVVKELEEGVLIGLAQTKIFSPVLCTVLGHRGEDVARHLHMHSLPTASQTRVCLDSPQVYCLTSS
jgi:hypothetical protein